MAGSLRDQLAEAFDKSMPEDGSAGTIALETPEARVETLPSEPSDPPSSRITEARPARAAQAAQAAQAAPMKGSTAAKQDAREAKQESLPLERPRDPETGQFVKEDEKKDTKQSTAKAAPNAPQPSAAVVHKAPPSPDAQKAAPVPPQPAPAQAQATSPAKARPPRPSSWKKEFWDQWEQIDPALAEYLHTRESQYANGVSTYKAELDAHKPVIEAMQQFMPELQQNKVEPSKWITELGNVHRVLAFGNPAQKLQTLANVARAYGVPLQAYSDQQAQQQFLQQGQFQAPYQPPQQPAQQPLTREEAQKIWQENYLQATSQQEIERFAADTAKHPHYEAVRETMAQLLDAGLAANLESAYEKAIRMDDGLWSAQQEQQRAAEEAERQRQAQERVTRARGKAVSPASATPNGPGSEEKPKGLRSTLSEAFDTHVAGRV